MRPLSWERICQQAQALDRDACSTGDLKCGWAECVMNPLAKCWSINRQSRCTTTMTEQQHSNSKALSLQLLMSINQVSQRDNDATFSRWQHGSHARPCMSQSSQAVIMGWGRAHKADSKRGSTASQHATDCGTTLPSHHTTAMWGVMMMSGMTLDWLGLPIPPLLLLL